MGLGEQWDPAAVHERTPQRTFERGYAALLDAQNGRALRTPAALKPGRRLTVHLAEGSADIALADVQPRLTDGF